MARPHRAMKVFLKIHQVSFYQVKLKGFPTDARTCSLSLFRAHQFENLHEPTQIRYYHIQYENTYKLSVELPPLLLIDDSSA